MIKRVNLDSRDQREAAEALGEPAVLMQTPPATALRLDSLFRVKSLLQAARSAGKQSVQSFFWKAFFYDQQHANGHVCCLLGTGVAFEAHIPTKVKHRAFAPFLFNDPEVRPLTNVHVQQGNAAAASVDMHEKLFCRHFREPFSLFFQFDCSICDIQAVTTGSTWKLLYPSKQKWTMKH